MRVIEAVWESYQRNVIPKGAGEVQVQETRRAFFAGMASMNALLDKIACMPEARAMAELSTAKAYLLNFALAELSNAQERSDT